MVGWCSALDNGVGKTPTLGWNSWNTFKDLLDENVVRDTAKLLQSTGLAAKGYVYLNLDDCWAAMNRSTSGELVPDPTKFPTPMGQLVEDIHAMGLKFGIYTDVGWMTCAKRPGTFQHEAQDAELFASWKVDYVKSDSCFTDANAPTFQPANGTQCSASYTTFEAALNATGRPMVHSVKGPCGRVDAESPSAPPPSPPHQQSCSPADASAVANLRRSSGDIKDNWDSVVRILSDVAAVARYSKPGYFADMDILEIGNGGLTPAEEMTMFTMWTVVKSPLLLGNDLSNMSAFTLSVIGNERLIAINQDALGVAAKQVVNTEGMQVWAGPLANGDTVAVLLNLGSSAAPITVNFATIGLAADATVAATNLWSNAVQQRKGSITASVDSHGVAAFRLKAGSPVVF